MPDTAYQQALITGYVNLTGNLQQQTLDYLLALYAQSPDYREATAEAFAAQAAPVVTGVQDSMSTLTQAYLSLLIADMTGEPMGSAGMAALNLAAGLRGVEPATLYRRPFEQVWYALSQGVAFDQAVQRGSDRLRDIAATDVQLAKTHTARDILSADERVVGYRRVLEGAYSCGLCVLASTQRYRKQALMPIHPACVLEGTRVSGPEALKGTRRWYSGEAVEISTASGDFLTVTPNHPVLTTRGWVPAGVLGEGDHVVSGLEGQRVVSGVPHKDQVPTSVEDRFYALSMDGLVRVPLAPEDFHGDVSDGDVGVVATDGLLRDGLVPAGVEPLGKRDLSVGMESATSLASQGCLVQLGFGRGPVSRRGVGGGGLGLPLCAAHAAGAEATSVGTVADLVAAGLDGFGESSTVESGFAGESVEGFACDVAGDEAFGHASDATRPKFAAPAAEFSGEGRALHAERGRGLLDRLSGQVQRDRVVFVSRRNLSAHVYNLHTAEGWFSANNIIVSNCDCGVAPIIGDHDPGQTINDQALIDVHTSIKERFGQSSVSGRGVEIGDELADYRDLLITHEHGEIGPVLARRGDHFDKPSEVG